MGVACPNFREHGMAEVALLASWRCTEWVASVTLLPAFGEVGVLSLEALHVGWLLKPPFRAPPQPSVLARDEVERSDEENAMAGR